MDDSLNDIDIIFHTYQTGAVRLPEAGVHAKEELYRIGSPGQYTPQSRITAVQSGEKLVYPVKMWVFYGTTPLLGFTYDQVEIVVDPLKIKDIGTYQINVNVKSKITNRLLGVPLKVTILSTDPLIQGYVPTVITSLGIPKNIAPREEIKNTRPEIGRT